METATTLPAMLSVCVTNSWPHMLSVEFANDFNGKIKSGLYCLKINLFIPEQIFRRDKYEPAFSTYHTEKHTGPETLSIHILAPVQLQESVFKPSQLN